LVSVRDSEIIELRLDDYSQGGCDYPDDSGNATALIAGTRRRLDAILLHVRVPTSGSRAVSDRYSPSDLEPQGYEVTISGDGRSAIITGFPPPESLENQIVRTQSITRSIGGYGVRGVREARRRFTLELSDTLWFLFGLGATLSFHPRAARPGADRRL
jgi:hypothetical protein